MKKISDEKKLALISIRKARTLLAKIENMIEKDNYCISVLSQLLAVQGLTKSASERILSKHLNSCFLEGLEKADNKKRKQLVSELLKVMNLEKRS